MTRQIWVYSVQVTGDKGLKTFYVALVEPNRLDREADAREMGRAQYDREIEEGKHETKVLKLEQIPLARK